MSFSISFTSRDKLELDTSAAAASNKSQLADCQLAPQLVSWLDLQSARICRNAADVAAQELQARGRAATTRAEQSAGETRDRGQEMAY